jgi:hypothetical protein
MYLEGGNRARAGKEKEKEISENELCLKKYKKYFTRSIKTNRHRQGRQAGR